MGHIDKFKRTTAVVASFVAVLSIAMSFAPQAYAGSVDLELDINASCGVAVTTTGTVTLNDDTTPGVNPGAIATGSFTVENTGTATQPIDADIGLGFFGQIDTTLHITSGAVTVESDDTNSVGPVTMTDDGTNGTPKPITNLEPTEGNDATITVDVDTDPQFLVNLPVSGTQEATLTLTLGTCF